MLQLITLVAPSVGFICFLAGRNHIRLLDRPPPPHRSVYSVSPLLQKNKNNVDHVTTDYTCSANRWLHMLLGRQ